MDIPCPDHSEVWTFMIGTTECSFSFVDPMYWDKNVVMDFGIFKYLTICWTDALAHKR